MNASRLHHLIGRVIAGIALLLLWPVFLAIALAVWLDDRRPILFRQTRVGRNGHPFLLYKFRSMRGSAGRSITASGDPRITRVGRILRLYKLDELPQFFNVLRGDMDFIGPRPEVPKYVDLGNPLWQAVLAVRPGISDLATLVFRNEEELLASKDDPEAHYRQVILPQKLHLNLRYMTERNPWRDAKLLLLTVRFSFRPESFQAETILRRF